MRCHHGTSSLFHKARPFLHCTQIATLPLYPVYTFFHPFLLCIVYLYASLAPPGAMTSILGLITVPSQSLPIHHHRPRNYIRRAVRWSTRHRRLCSRPSLVVVRLGVESSPGRVDSRNIPLAPTWVSEWYGEGSRPGGRDAPDAGGQVAGLAQPGYT